MMNEMRRLIQLVEIEIGGAVDGSYLDDIQQTDFRSKQQDLFPELPTLEPELTKDFEEIGRLGEYYIARKKDSFTKSGDPEYSYVLFDKGVPFGYVAVIDPDSDYADGYWRPNPPLSGEGLRVISVYIDKSHRGQNIAIKLYEWLLRNVCDYILPDELQTYGGVAIWKKLLNRPKIFDVMVYDDNNQLIRRRWSGKDFNQVYQTSHLRPFVTLAGKADELMSDY